jgi:hypothetical protein
VRFWRFRSQTPVAKDPERMTDMVEKLVRVGVLTPEEGRVLAGDIFNREFRKISDELVSRPITLTLAAYQNSGPAVKPEQAHDALLENAQRLLSLREELDAEVERLAKEHMEHVRENEAGATETHSQRPTEEPR